MFYLLLSQNTYFNKATALNSWVLCTYSFGISGLCLGDSTRAGECILGSCLILNEITLGIHLQFGYFWPVFGRLHRGRRMYFGLLFDTEGPCRRRCAADLNGQLMEGLYRWFFLVLF